jgi:O-antigen/teichoic acid export membrane protein
VLLGASSAGSKIAFLFFTLYVANRLGVDLMGQYGFLMSAVAVLLVVADLGVEGYSERELARRRDLLRSRARYLVLFRVLGVVPLAVVPGVMLHLHTTGRYHPSLVILGPLLALTIGLFNLLRSCIRSTEKMIYEAILFNAERFSFMALGLAALMYAAGDLGWFVGAETLASFLGIVAAYFVLRRLAGIETESPPEGFGFFTRETVRASLPFWMTALCATILYREDVLMLSWLSNDVETGRYYTSFRITEGLLLIPQSLALAVYPTFSRMTHARRDIGPIFRVLYRFLFASGVGLAIVGVSVAGTVFSLFKPEFAPSSGILAILVCSIPFTYGNYLIGTTMRSADRQVKNFHATVAAMLVNFVGNLILIPVWQARGAALATVFTQALYLLLMFRFSRGFMEVRKPLMATFWLLCLGGVVRLLMEFGGQHVIVTSVFGFLGFALLCFVLRILHPGEVSYVIRALRRKEN